MLDVLPAHIDLKASALSTILCFLSPPSWLVCVRRDGDSAYVRFQYSDVTREGTMVQCQNIVSSRMALFSRDFRSENTCSFIYPTYLSQADRLIRPEDQIVDIFHGNSYVGVFSTIDQRVTLYNVDGEAITELGGQDSTLMIASTGSLEVAVAGSTYGWTSYIGINGLDCTYSAWQYPIVHPARVFFVGDKIVLSGEERRLIVCTESGNMTAYTFPELPLKAEPVFAGVVSGRLYVLQHDKSNKKLYGLPVQLDLTPEPNAPVEVLEEFDTDWDYVTCIPMGRHFLVWWTGREWAYEALPV